MERRGARGPNAIGLGEKIREALGGLGIDQDRAQRILRALIIQGLGFAAFGAVPSDPPAIRDVFCDSLDWTLSGALHVGAQRPGTPKGPGMSDALAPISGLYRSLDLARSSDRRLGEAILKEGGIEFDVAGARVVALVRGRPGTTRRRVTFEQGRDGLRWSCTCMSAPSPWCKHAIAVIIAAATTTGGVRP